MLDTYKTEDAKVELLRKTESVRTDTDKIEKLIIRQIEYTRKRYGFTQIYFSKLLGVSNQFYSKMTLGQREPPIFLLIRYCQIFGLDISGLVAEEYLNSTDTVLRELAMYMTLLSDKTISALTDTIADSDESDRIKERGELLLDRLQTMEDKPRPFFIKDLPLENISEEDFSDT